MKVKSIFCALSLAVLLVALFPASALAAKPTAFSAGGTIDSITPGDVFPAGKSGRWVVAERALTGSLLGDINGDFTMTYKANIESVETQAGNFHGTMTVAGGEYVLKVNGTIEPLEFWTLIEFPPGSGNLVPVFKLTISGHGTFIEGAKGNAEFAGEVFFIPTPDGHVAYILGSGIIVSGTWH